MAEPSDLANESHSFTGPGMPVLRGTRLPIGDSDTYQSHTAVSARYWRPHDYTWGTSNPALRPFIPHAANQHIPKPARRRKRPAAARPVITEPVVQAPVFVEPVTGYPVSEPLIPAHVVARHRRKRRREEAQSVSRNRATWSEATDPRLSFADLLSILSDDAP